MPGADRKPKTLYDKVFEDHIVNEQDDGTILIYIGMQNIFFVHRQWLCTNTVLL